MISIPSIPRSLIAGALGLFALVLVSCDGVELNVGPGPGTPLPVTPGPERVGELRVDQPGVLLNQQPVSGRVTLHDRDKVRTTTGRATILFDVGGRLMLAPDTDPLLRLIRQAGCLSAELVTYLREGEFNFQNVSPRLCLCDEANGYCAVPSSDLRVRIDQNGSSILVDSGRVRVAVGPPGQQRIYTVRQGEAIQVRRGRTGGPQPILR